MAGFAGVGGNDGVGVVDPRSEPGREIVRYERHVTEEHEGAAHVAHRSDAALGRGRARWLWRGGELAPV